MDTDNILSEILSEAEAKARYDAVCKSILSAKIILAWILKFCVEEFKDHEAEEIVEYIEGEPEISKVGVMPNTTNPSMITGESNEDSSINEGTVLYDILFTAVTPGKERIKMIINVEAQNSYYPGYPLKKRAIYYGCRMVSSQYGREFGKSDYGEIKKVYTIWICMNSPKEKQNKIGGYSIQPYKIIGDLQDDNNDHDLMRCVMIHLGEKEDEDQYGLLRLLEVLLSEEKTPEEKKGILENDYKIEMTEEMDEEVYNMCNLSTGIAERNRELGRNEGMEKGILNSLRSLMENMKLTAEQAMKALDVPESEWDKYMPKLR